MAGFPMSNAQLLAPEVFAVQDPSVVRGEVKAKNCRSLYSVGRNEGYISGLNLNLPSLRLCRR